MQNEQSNNNNKKIKQTKTQERKKEIKAKTLLHFIYNKYKRLYFLHNKFNLVSTTTNDEVNKTKNKTKLKQNELK